MTRHIISQKYKLQNHDYAPVDCCARKSLLRSSHRTTHKTETPSPDANLNRRDLGTHRDLNGAFGGVRLIFVMCNSMQNAAWILPAPSPVGCQVKKANRAARTASEHSNAAAVQHTSTSSGARYEKFCFLLHCDTTANKSRAVQMLSTLSACRGSAYHEQYSEERCRRSCGELQNCGGSLQKI